MRIWTPLELQILLHFHCYGSPWPKPSEPAQKAYDLLKAEGLVALREPGEYPTTTMKGRAFVKLLSSTPIPEHVFVDPRTREVVCV